MKKSLILVTDLYYQARGREYYREDIALSQLLRSTFNLVLVHIEDLQCVAPYVDAILLRNTGPIANHQNLLEKLQTQTEWPIFNDLSGKGDIKGKYHLIELFSAGYPVIPSVRSFSEIEKLGATNQYMLKPLDGCDSHGIEVGTKEEISKLNLSSYMIQPNIKFSSEVSFYFIGKEFQYALSTVHPEQRWQLNIFKPSEKELKFATSFIEWNSCTRGIQRVDACRNEHGELLLMELEDYNPFLSLELLEKETVEKFIKKLSQQITHFI